MSGNAPQQNQPKLAALTEDEINHVQYMLNEVPTVGRQDNVHARVRAKLGVFMQMSYQTLMAERQQQEAGANSAEPEGAHDSPEFE